ncbi:MAG: hypothetical protein V7L31_00025 [Nostoc sp.]|uniref:hypothetical protein n=1 Tax=Nostoc sp. TaxID=1180 RepID=UPI002FF02BB2
MTTELYKIQYVEMTPAQVEESEDELEILEIVAEVEGDAFEAIHFWIIDMEWSIVDYHQVKGVIPLVFLSPMHYMALKPSK